MKLFEEEFWSEKSGVFLEIIQIIVEFIMTFSIERWRGVIPIERLIKFVEVSDKLSKDLDFESVILCFLFGAALKSLTISAEGMLKKPCATELNKVILCLRINLIEIVLKNLMISVIVACTKRHGEKYILH